MTLDEYIEELSKIRDKHGGFLPVSHDYFTVFSVCPPKPFVIEDRNTSNRHVVLADNWLVDLALTVCLPAIIGLAILFAHIAG